MAEREGGDAVAAKVLGCLFGKSEAPRHWYEPVECSEDQTAIGMDPLYAVDRVQSTKPVSEILPAVAQSFRPSANVSGLATGPDHEIAPVSGSKAPQSRMQAFRGNSGRYRPHAEPDQKPWTAMGFSTVDA